MNKTLLPFVISLTAANAFASEAVPYLEEVVVASSRTPMSVREVGTSISVITADDIKLQGFSSLFDVLRSQTAVGASNTGGLGKATSLRVRGEEGYRTRVLIDGIDISDPSGTQVNPQPQHILSNGIGRVEILRGPQGMMYGADAGGVVSISSNTVTDGVQGGVSAEGGRYDTRQIDGYIGAGSDVGDVFLSVADLHTNGFNTRVDDATGERDGYDNQTVHFTGGWNIADSLRLQGVVRRVETETEYDSGFGNSHVNEYDQTAARLALTVKANSGNHTFAYNNTDIDSDDYFAGVYSFGSQGELEKIEYLGNTNINEVFAVVYGIEDRDEEMTSSAGETFQRDQQGYFVEGQMQWDKRVYLTAGIREDDNDDFGKHVSYRVTSAYVIDFASADVLKFKASYATGFRAPSLYEISYNAGPWGNNEVLKEETSKGFDAGIEYFASSSLYVELVYFAQDINDEIFFDLTTFSGYLQETGKTNVKGVELTADIPFNSTLSATVNYTYNDTKDHDGDRRIRRPRHLANIGVTFQAVPEKLVVAAYWHIVRDMTDETTALGVIDLDDYDTLVLSANYALNDHVQAYARVENATDENYQEVYNYRTAGSSAYVGMRYSF